MTSNVARSISVEEVVVIGTGFIGLPLALILASEGKTVYGIDIDENLIQSINDQTLNIDDDEIQALIDDEEVQENLVASTEPRKGDAFVISVPTPLSEPAKSPDLSSLEAALESILPYLEQGNLINIESTIPPLTCKNYVVPLLEENGYVPGEDVHLAHSPERILPGNVIDEIINNDRVIGGLTEECAQMAEAVYDPFLKGSVYRTNPTSAELCKLVENTYRDVNVALANEFSLIAEKLDVDVGEVISLANNHPRVDVLSPGIGVGGHCLPVDPWFLNEVAPEETELITEARRINDGMPQVAARKIRRAVSEFANPKILALGAAYKPNTYDQRNSPAIEIVEELRLDGYQVVHYDSKIDSMEFDDLGAVINEENPDFIVQLVPHQTTVTELEELDDFLSSQGIELFQFGVDNE